MLLYEAFFKNILMGFPLLHLRVVSLLTSRTDIQLSEVPGPQKGIEIFLVGMSIEEPPHSQSLTPKYVILGSATRAQ